MMPQSKFNRVKIKAYELTNTYENRKFVFPFLTKYVFVNDGGKSRFLELV